MTTEEILSLPELTDDVENAMEVVMTGESIHGKLPDGSTALVAVAKSPDGTLYKISTIWSTGLFG